MGKLSKAISLMILMGGTISTIAAAEEKVKVSGIGGFFFRSDNPRELAEWYLEHLGINLAPRSLGDIPWSQQAGFTVLDPMNQASTKIPEGKTWMINFRVPDLEAMVRQLRNAGIEVQDIVQYPHGKFANLLDPEGNGIELWEPTTQN